MLVMFFSVPRLVRGLGDTSFAILALVWTVMTYFTLWDFGIGRAVTKFVAEKRAIGKDEEVADVIKISVAVGLVIGIASGALVYLFRSQLGHLLFTVETAYAATVRASLVIVAVSMPVLLLQGVLRGVLMGFDRFDLANLVQIANGVIQWGGALVLVLLHFDVITVIAFVMFSRFLTTILFAVLILGLVRLRPLNLRLNLSLMRDILGFGGWAMVSQVISPVLQYAERFILSGVIATSIVTFYVVPYEATSKMLVLSVGLVSALFPAMSEIHGVEGLSHEFRKLYAQSQRILIISFLPIGAAIFTFAPEILRFWMGKSFALSAETVFEILTVAFMINSVGQMPFMALQAVGRPDLTAKVHMAELPIHFLITFVLISKFGLLGAAVATLIRIVIDASLFFAIASIRFDLNVELFRSFWKRYATPVACIAVGMCFAIIFQHMPLVKIFSALVSLSLYIMFVYRLTLEKVERATLRGLVLRRANV